jgi:peptidyl-tRNA hydrolase, PTH1 family
LFCIVGLGNPGKEYQRNRHNIGFDYVDCAVSQYNASSARLKFHSEFYEAEISGRKIFFLKPLTYMNRSGIAVSELKTFYKLPLENILVVHDELDIPLGELRMKRGGGSAGHNGLKSIDAMIGADYFRLRLGIGRPPWKGDVSGWVLGNFTETEKNIITPVTEAAAKLLPVFIEEGAEKYKNRLATIQHKTA